MILAFLLFLAQANSPVIPSTASKSAAQAIALAAYKPNDAKQSFVDNYVRSFVDSTNKNPQAVAMLAQHPGLENTLMATVRSEAGRQYDLVVGPAMVTNLAQAYEANFTTVELDEIANYYRSPEAQRLLALLSAKAAAADIATAQSSPLVQRYAASGAGRKERALSGPIASAMMRGIVDQADTVNAAILPKVRALIEAALRSPRKPKG